MTREEAIKYLSEELEKTKEVIALTERDFGVSESVWHTEAAAFKLAIAALREQDSNANQHVSNTSNALGGWNSVEERLPEPDTDVLARRSIGIGVECYHKEDGGYWSWDEYCGKWRVTHWMLLPEPPEVEV